MSQNKTMSQNRSRMRSTTIVAIRALMLAPVVHLRLTHRKTSPERGTTTLAA